MTSISSGGTPNISNTEVASISNTTSGGASTSTTPAAASPHQEISEPAFEFLLSSILHRVEAEARKDYARNNSLEDEDEVPKKSFEPKEDPNILPSDNTTRTLALSPQSQSEQRAKAAAEQSLIAEHAAAKMERLGYDVGYRLMERVAQSKGLAPPSSGGSTKPPTPAAKQLEAIKFVCKEFWTLVFQKQIDKLQTNHRGVFVLKDSEFKWLKRLPGNVGVARIMAIKILAFPCGLIRGALANLGISTVVSCDFLSDGVNMASCSFNLKIK